MNEEIRKHPLNAKGKYYVDQNSCGCMGACEFVFPQHFKIDEGTNCAYVVRQPETLEEEFCQEAMDCCAFEAIHNDGE